ncbi:hypothetical protein HUJ04_011369 [Dendroctonus ponderosae]|nr:hypothetical protein HUJ04_011369 [Dendroctonus ponderosae]
MDGVTESPSVPCNVFNYKYVTYGLKRSAFLATRCLVELAHTEKVQFPLASKALLNNTYVDNILTGSDTIEDAINLKHELISLLNLRSFSLHKWCANESSILDDIPKENQNFDEIDIDKNNFTTKTLGFSYDTINDHFKLSTPISFENNENLTKRQVLTSISKFYDLLGLAGPVLVEARIIMQKISNSRVGLDEILPSHLLEERKYFVKEFLNMPTLRIPRN